MVERWLLTSLSVLALEMFVTRATGWISCTTHVIAAQSVAPFDLGMR